MKESDNQKQVIGERIKVARSALGLTQKELCEKTGMPLQSLRGYELSHRTPGGDAIEYLVRLGINANWLLIGEGTMLLSDVQPRPAPPEAQDEQPLMHMAGITTPEGAASAGQVIDESLLSSCHAACRTVYGDEFDALSPVVQMGYATDLYGLLVRLCASNGKDLGEMKRLEVNGLIELLKTYVRLGWARKFPPPSPDLYSF